MKEIFLVNVHSFSDVITNSSTDIFACKSENSVDAIRILLNEIASAAGGSAGLTVEESTLKSFFNRISDYICYDLGIRPNEKTWKFDVSLDDIFKVWVEKKSKYFFGGSTDPDTKIVVICGTDDNSIPYWLQEYIEDKLNAVRYHLG